MMAPRGATVCMLVLVVVLCHVAAAFFSNKGAAAAGGAAAGAAANHPGPMAASAAAASAVAPGEVWKKGAAWSKHRFNITSPLPLPQWGSFRPGIYFGMKTRTPIALNTGIMWAAGKVGDQHKVRHEAVQDELAQFHWIKHDGRHFGMEMLRDAEYDMSTLASFVVPPPRTSAASWAQRVVVEPLATEAERAERGASDLDQKNLFFYLGTEGTTTTPALTDVRVVGDVGADCGSGRRVLSVVGKSRQGWFRLDLQAHPAADAPGGVNVTYYGGTFAEATVGARQVQGDAMVPHWASQTEAQEQSRLFTTDGQFKNAIAPGANFVTVCVQAVGGFSLDAVLYENVPATGIEDLVSTTKQGLAARCASPDGKDSGSGSGSGTDVGSVTRTQISEWIGAHAAAFDAKFDTTFQLAEKTDPRTGAPMFSADDVEVGRRALSAVLGGIGYFYGEPRVGNALDSPPLPATYPTQEERDAAEAHFKAKVQQIYRSSLELTRAPAVSLLTATPSRTSFPRGFLWDEGFHQMVISQWDVGITLQVLADWLNAMYHCAPPAAAAVAGNDASGGMFGSLFGTGGKKGAADTPAYNCSGGWIPREMILGADAERRVPNEFITQRVDIANPPTLLLVVDSLLDRVTAPKAANTCANTAEGRQQCAASAAARDDENKAILKFLQDAYPALHEWVTWLRTSQKGGMGVMDGSSQTVIEDTFRWRGRVPSDEQKLITNTLASGLDDYPRSPLPSEQEFHLDLFCWIFTAARVMSRLERTLLARAHKEGAVAKKIAAIQKTMGGLTYDNFAGRLQSRLEFLHWSHPHQVFCDVGYSSDLAVVVTDLAMRCQNQETGKTMDLAVPLEYANSGKPFCPPEYPHFLGGVSDGEGGVRSQRRFGSPEPLKFQHIPRIGYVSLFPLLLKVLPLGSPRLDRILDVMESEEHLWTDYGLRSISKNDTFYHIGNAPGDEPYWRGPIWVNVNYLALKALQYYRSIPVEAPRTDGEEDEDEEEGEEEEGEGGAGRRSSGRSQKKKKRRLAAEQDEEKKLNAVLIAQRDQQNRMAHVYNRLRANVQNNVLSNYHQTGYFWEHYDDVDGRGTRGHPFSGWTTLVLNIMAEI